MRDLSPMTTFTWKHKIGENVCKDTVKKFRENGWVADDNNEFEPTDDVLSIRPKRSKVFALEDKETKKRRLEQEGCLLAENDRPWEAIRKWDEAIQLTPDDERLHEMKAQVLSGLHEVLSAIKSAERAVQLKPNWWVAHQTLGRAQLCLGEVNLAIGCFSRACHLNPSEEELWEEDLRWAISLREQQSVMAKTKADSSSSSSGVKQQPLVIREVNEEEGRNVVQIVTNETKAEVPIAVPKSGDQIRRLSVNSWIRMRSTT